MDRDICERPFPGPLVPCLWGTEWRHVKNLTPPVVDSLAKQTGALQRRRVIRSATDLLRLVLAYAVNDMPLDQTSHWASLIRLGRLSSVATWKRLSKCEPFLRQLIAAWMQDRAGALPVRRARLRVVDASAICVPGAKGTSYRLHVGLDLETLCLDHVELTDGRGGESLLRHTFQPGDIAIGDRGYAHAAGIGFSLSSKGVSLVVRVPWQSLRCETDSGNRLDLVRWLKGLPKGSSGELNVLLPTPQGTLRVRVIAYPQPEEVAQAERKRAEKESRKKNHKPQEGTQVAAGFIILLTDLPPAIWTAEQVLEVYRWRWQVELAFKRLKSILSLDGLRTECGALSEVYLLGKLLATLILDAWIADIKARDAVASANRKRTLKHWFLTRYLLDHLRSIIRGPVPLEGILAWDPKLDRYIREGPRKRQPQAEAIGARLRVLNAA